MPGLKRPQKDPECNKCRDFELQKGKPLKKHQTSGSSYDIETNIIHEHIIDLTFKKKYV